MFCPNTAAEMTAGVVLSCGLPQTMPRVSCRGVNIASFHWIVIAPTSPASYRNEPVSGARPISVVKLILYGIGAAVAVPCATISPANSVAERVRF